MQPIVIRNQSVEVDIVGELEQFNWTRPRWTSDKLLAASPFRYDKTPSFFVRLEPYGDLPAGVWHDSGAYDSEWASGNFVKLLSYLRNETYEETEDYLICEYGVATADQLSLLPLQLKERKGPRYLPADYLDTFGPAPKYVSDRRIHPKVAELYGVRFDAKSNAVVLPWFGANGRLANVKYRKLQGKVFWYAKGAEPVRNLVWGANVINERQVKRAVLCEGEFDAMSWATAGIAGIAVGGVSFTEHQADVLRRSSVEELLIGADNDKAGRKLVEQVRVKLGGHVGLRELDYSKMSEYKDANDVLKSEGVSKLKELYATSIKFDKISLRMSNGR